MAYCRNCGKKLENGAKFCPQCGNPTDEVKNSADNDNQVTNQLEEVVNQEQPERMGCWKKMAIGVGSFLAFIFLVGMCGDDEQSNTPTSEQVVSSEKTGKESEKSKKVVDEPKEFFDNGYVYTASYNIDRDQEGRSESKTLKLKIYKDGTSQILSSTKFSNGYVAEPRIHKCTIKKESGSHPFHREGLVLAKRTRLLFCS